MPGVVRGGVRASSRDTVGLLQATQGLLPDAPPQTIALLLKSYDGQNRVSMGRGLPTGGQPGDFFFRTDTPGVGNQRIYVNIASVWTGIL